MRKNIALKLATISSIITCNAYAADDLSGMFKDGDISGQIRSFYIDRTYQGSAGNDLHRNGTAIGGHLKYVTDEYKGLNLGTAFYTTNKIGASPDIDPTLFGKDNEGYSILGEAYLEYKRGNTTFKGGRQILNTPLAGADDARMIPNLFEAYLIQNKDVENLTITAGYINRFAQGTFGRVYNGGLLSVTSGYSYVDSRDQVGDFVGMGDYAVGKNTAGVAVGSLIYSPTKNIKLQAWDYYAYDILNAVYAQADFSWKCLISDSVKPYFAAQMIKEDEVGDKYAGYLNGLYWAGKFGAKVGGFNAYIAYSQTSKNSANENIASGGLENAILSPWGGMPAFTQGMVTRHQFLAGTKASKVAASYSFKDSGVNLSTTAYYTSFDMDANSGYGISRTATEPGVDVIYYPKDVDNLQLRFRANFPRKFAESSAGDTGWNEYRLIVNYNF
jgi:imipenem/basic amino acid-specific outer membrane pore